MGMTNKNTQQLPLERFLEEEDTTLVHICIKDMKTGTWEVFTENPVTRDKAKTIIRGIKKISPTIEKIRILKT